MAWNLRRSKLVFPGVRINLSKAGLGLSVGPRHSHISISPKGRITTNLGIPGTGIRYTDRVELGGEHRAKDADSVESSSTNVEKPMMEVPVGTSVPMKPRKPRKSKTMPALEGEPSELVCKYRILSSEGATLLETENRDLVDIAALTQYARSRFIVAETVIRDNETERVSTAKELLGSWVFGE